MVPKKTVSVPCLHARAPGAVHVPDMANDMFVKTLGMNKPMQCNAFDKLFQQYSVVFDTVGEERGQMCVCILKMSVADVRSCPIGVWVLGPDLQYFPALA